jgi:hypothetical protein
MVMAYETIQKKYQGAEKYFSKLNLEHTSFFNILCDEMGGRLKHFCCTPCITGDSRKARICLFQFCFYFGASDAPQGLAYARQVL